MVVALKVSKIGRGQRSEGLGHNEMDCNSLKTQFKTIIILYYWTWMCTKWPALAEVCAVRALL